MRYMRIGDVALIIAMILLGLLMFISGVMGILTFTGVTELDGRIEAHEHPEINAVIEAQKELNEAVGDLMEAYREMGIDYRKGIENE